MALIKETTSPTYVRTGESPGNAIATFFFQLSNKSTFSPILSGTLSALFGGIATFADTAGWLLRGKPLSAGTAFAAGSVSVATNTTVSAGGVLNPLWWGNMVQGVVTGRSAGTHARMLTENAIGLVVKPTVLRTYMAGVGGVNGAAVVPPAPGKHAQFVMGGRGVTDMDAYHQQKIAGEAGAYVHRGGPAYQGI